MRNFNNCFSILGLSQFYDVVNPVILSPVFSYPYQSATAGTKKSSLFNRFSWVSVCVTFGGIGIYQSLPSTDSYVYEQFITNTTGENKHVRNYLRWSFILAATGLFEKLSKYDLPFYFIRSFVEHYLEFQYCTVFEENKHQRVYFRGEYKKDANTLLDEGKHRLPLPYSIASGQFSLPYVKDATLEPLDEGVITANPNGFTKGAISLTSDLQVTKGYGHAECVLFVVLKNRVASVAHHALKNAQNYQYEYICGGIRNEEILLIAYRDPDTHEFDKVKFNAGFGGDIDRLELDPQAQSVIDLIPDSDPRKARLQARINPALDYRDSYDCLVAPDLETHRQKLPERVHHNALHGYNGKRFLRKVHANIHLSDWGDYLSRVSSPFLFTRPHQLESSTVWQEKEEVLESSFAPKSIDSGRSKVQGSPIAELENLSFATESIDSGRSKVQESPTAELENLSFSFRNRSFSFAEMGGCRLSPKQAARLASPSNYNRLNESAQKEMREFLASRASSVEKQGESYEDADFSGISVSRRAVLGCAYGQQSAALRDEEKKAPDAFFGFDSDVEEPSNAALQPQSHSMIDSKDAEDHERAVLESDSDDDQDTAEKSVNGAHSTLRRKKGAGLALSNSGQSNERNPGVQRASLDASDKENAGMGGRLAPLDSGNPTEENLGVKRASSNGGSDALYVFFPSRRNGLGFVEGQQVIVPLLENKEHLAV